MTDKSETHNAIASLAEIIKREAMHGDPDGNLDGLLYAMKLLDEDLR